MLLNQYQNKQNQLGCISLWKLQDLETAESLHKLLFSTLCFVFGLFLEEAVSLCLYSKFLASQKADAFTNLTS